VVTSLYSGIGMSHHLPTAQTTGNSSTGNRCAGNNSTGNRCAGNNSTGNSSTGNNSTSNSTATNDSTTTNDSTANGSSSNRSNSNLTLNSNEMSSCLGSGLGLLADLSGNLVGHGLAHLPWDSGASLSGDSEGNLPGNLGACLPGNAVAHLLGDGVADLLWHAVANLLGDGVALLLGNVVADLLGHAVAHLLGDIVADGLGNGPGGVNALGLGNLGALGAGDVAGLLDWLLVADTLGGSLAPGGTSDTNDTSEVWFGISLTLPDSAPWSPHSSQSMDTSKGSSTGNNTSSNSTTSNDTTANNTTADNTTADNTTADSSTTNNTTSNHIALNSNQSSPGLGTVLGDNVSALINDGSINNWDGFSDAVLASGGGALLVGDLLDNVSADLLGFSVADLLRFGVAHFLGHGVADLFGHGVADLLVDGVADLLLDSVANLLVNGFADVVEFSLELGLGDCLAHLFRDGGTLLGGGHIVDGPADGCGHSHSGAPGSNKTSSMPCLGIGLWLAQGQWCDEGKNNQKLIHCDAELETNFH